MGFVLDDEDSATGHDPAAELPPDINVIDDLRASEVDILAVTFEQFANFNSAVLDDEIVRQVLEPPQVDSDSDDDTPPTPQPSSADLAQALTALFSTYSDGQTLSDIQAHLIAPKRASFVCGLLLGAGDVRLGTTGTTATALDRHARNDYAPDAANTDLWLSAASAYRHMLSRRDSLPLGTAAPSTCGSQIACSSTLCSAEGLVDGAALVFCAKKGAGDYHTEMDAASFQKWFVEQLLPNIKPHSVTVMDNSSYHSAQVEKVLSLSSRKVNIERWLKSKSIPFSDDQLKSELLQLVKQNKHMFLAYQIDTLASTAGHEVVRLPPYYCELNPIELMWSQVKGYVASTNTAFKVDSAEKLLLEAIAGVTPQNWFRDCTCVIRLEDEAWKRDGIIDIQRKSQFFGAQILVLLMSQTAPT
ncbi:hypothetical protein HPB49_007601 [Dermacentor silvarum]|uniref:Uncharacterized protein n=1 Tax=Dermacentor silvarum TaxID=543639 RepID=A0ACB8CDZ2_DERSI|nr:hypothetical protein HPB49_007601 [Dermacentor silvarum]